MHSVFYMSIYIRSGGRVCIDQYQPDDCYKMKKLNKDCAGVNKCAYIDAMVPVYDDSYFNTEDDDLHICNLFE